MARVYGRVVTRLAPRPDLPLESDTAGSGSGGDIAIEVLLAGEFSGTQDVDMSTLLRDVPGPCVRLTVAVVAVPTRMLCYGMPFCGVALIDQANEGLMRDAGRKACRLASAAPDGVCAEHLVTERW